MVTLVLSVDPRFLWLPGVSTGEDGGGAQQLFVQVGGRHREGRVLGQQHTADGQQSLKSREITSAWSLKTQKGWEMMRNSLTRPSVVVTAHFRRTQTESGWFNNH